MNITVLYGSETGTAQDIAEEIWKSAKRKNLRSSVKAMDDYDIEKLISEKLIIFVVATTGQGDPPSNMKKFWRFLLRKSLGPVTLINLKYAVLGLGDSSYQKFNFAAKKLNKRLMQLGAKSLLPIGLADDQHDLGIDGTADPWRAELWGRILNIFNIPMPNEMADQKQIIERFDVSIIEKKNMGSINEANILKNDIYMQEISVKPELNVGVVLKNIRTTAEDHFQDVRLINFHCNNINYVPGDIAYIRPKNSQQQVEKFFKVLNDNNVQLHSDMWIKVSEREIKVPEVLKQDLTLGQIVEQYWDLNFKPRRSTMQTLSLISENELEKEKLLEFSASTGQEELYSYINRPRRNIIEFLIDFPYTTSKLDIKTLFEIMSPIKPRPFSIASSSKATENEIHLLIAVVKFKTKLCEPRFGLCSNWLASLQEEDKVIFWIQQGTFKFNYQKPMILIGPGTGVAPFRSLLLEKAALQRDLIDCTLFFGCRNKHKDYHCRSEFERLSNEMRLKLFCAFSRDQDHKIYVQHLIYKQKELCWDFLKRGGCIYLAGSSKNMPNCVREEFIRIIKETAQLTKEEAEKFIQHLETSNRYQCETWG